MIVFQSDIDEEFLVNAMYKQVGDKDLTVFKRIYGPLNVGLQALGYVTIFRQQF